MTHVKKGRGLPMAFTDPRLPQTEPSPGNVQDVIPPTERNQDPLVTEMTHGLTAESARPLTEEERKAADRDAPAGERVFAPASERVPVKPVEGHRDFIEHPDTHTPEREAAGVSQSTEEPTFTRVARPSTAPTAGPYASTTSGPSWQGSSYSTADWAPSRQRPGWLGTMGMGWLTFGVCSGVGAWLWLRWQRERNKPMNRLRRQARQAADEFRERVPSPEDAARPAMGLTTAILSILLIVWQQSQARAKHADKVVSRGAGKARRRASDAVSDADWQKRLTKLKDRWTPGRLELEKVSLSR
jgi:hypothetical protein